MKNILSIDGGGVRIYFPLRILGEIEKRLNVHIHELFDYFTGVSAGSILIGMLLKGSNGTPQYTIDELCELLEKNAPRIFHKSWSNRFKTLGSLIGPTYSSESIETCFQDLYENVTLKDLIKPACIVSYNMLNNSPVYFTAEEYPDLELWKCVRASTAAPTYFYPYEFEYKQQEYVCIDGGVITNNPSEICLLKALKQQRQKYFTFSLGTGYYADNKKHERSFWKKFLPSYGLLYWSSDILNTIFNASSNSQIMDLETINSLIENKESHRFYRVNIRMNENIGLDDVYSFGRMKSIADEWILKNTEEIDFMCGNLMKNYETRIEKEWIQKNEPDHFVKELDDLMRKSYLPNIFKLEDIIE